MLVGLDKDSAAARLDFAVKSQTRVPKGLRDCFVGISLNATTELSIVPKRSADFFGAIPDDASFNDTSTSPSLRR